MTFAYGDRIKVTNSAPGTGAFTATGNAVTGFRDFASCQATGTGSAVANNDRVPYAAWDGGSNWEVGIATYNSTGPVLTRTTILKNSAGTGSAINFAGTVTIWCDVPAANVVMQDQSGNLLYGGQVITGVTGTGPMVLGASPTFTGTVIASGITTTTLTAGNATGTTPFAMSGQDGANYMTLNNGVTPYGYIGNGAGLVGGGVKTNLVIDSNAALQFVVNNNGVVAAMVGTDASFLVGHTVNTGAGSISGAGDIIAGWNGGAALGGRMHYTTAGNTVLTINNDYAGNNSSLIQFGFGAVGSNVALYLAKSLAVQMPGYGVGTATFDASGNISSVSDPSQKIIVGKFKPGLREIIRVASPEFMALHKWRQKSGMETKSTYASFLARDNFPISKAVFKSKKTGINSFSDRPVVMALVNAVAEVSARLEKLEAAA